MAITLTCPSCSTKLRGPDGAAGRRVSCPKCKKPIYVPAATPSDDDGTIPLASPYGQTTPGASSVQNLIPCAACGHQIAPAAASCPQCGNPNRYVHPEIQRFVNAAQSFRHMPQFHYKVDGFVLSGWASAQKGAVKTSSQGIKLVLAAVLIGMFGTAIPPLLPIAGLLLVIGFILHSSTIFSGVQPTDYFTRFSIDFNQVPPKWQSDDDAYWKEIKAFFPVANVQSP